MEKLGELVLELTDWCPLGCRHCSSESGPHRTERLPKHVALRLVREAAALGAEKVSLGGGEPTGSPIFLEVLRKVASLGMHVEVFTCGVWQDGSGTGRLPQGLVAEAGQVRGVKFIFSVHGPSPAVHDDITNVPGSFGCLERSVDACLAARIECEINFVPLRPNAGTFGEVIRFAERKGINRVSVLRFVPQGRGWPNRSQLELGPEEEQVFLAELGHLRSATPIDVRTGSPFNGLIPGNAVPCRAGSAKLVVQADGNVLPCEVYKDCDRRDWGASVGNSTLRQILTSQGFQLLREALARQECPRCPVHAVAASERGGPKRHLSRLGTPDEGRPHGIPATTL